MMSDCWGKVFAQFGVTLQVDECLVAGDDRAVFTNRYVGSERASDQPVDAVFAHVFRLQGHRITELQQFTDTARWAVG